MDRSLVIDILRDLSPLKEKIAFKGGTSLYFKFNFMNRVSVDLDLMFLDESVKKEIRELLSLKGYSISEPETGEYGVFYNISNSKWEKEMTIAIDMSKYILKEIPEAASQDGKGDKLLLSRLLDESPEVTFREDVSEDIEIKHFNRNITFYEKLLAGSSAVSKWDEKEMSNNLIRKVRHLEDVVRLHNGGVINYSVDKWRRIANLNEINKINFHNINKWHELPIFNDELIKKVENFYTNKWDDEYLNGDEKLPFNEIIKGLKEIKKKLSNYNFVIEGKTPIPVKVDS